MREILFRGKRIDNWEWVFGHLYVTHNGDYEIGCYNPDTKIERWTFDVDPSTVGQYTGLTDKNGKRIFEGDVCLCDRNIAPSVDEQTFQIIFDVEAGQWIGRGPNSDIDASQFCMCEVVKTVHDNPELLEGGNA